MSEVLEAFLLPAAPARPGQRMCLHHPPRSDPIRGAFVYVHPFAEEMNKSRRMAALQSRALAAAGCAVLQIDLLGCGDSSGDFADATWSDWIADVVLGARWLRTRYPGAPLWLWGLRAGALLACEAAARLDEPCRLLFWQPPPRGKPLLQQFLRLATMRELLDGGEKGLTDALRAALTAGDSIDVAGYRVAAALARGLEAATLAPPPRCERAVWLEVSPHPTPGPAAAATIAQWSAAGIDVEFRSAPGPAFWNTVEIEEAPALLAATLAALDEAVPA